MTRHHRRAPWYTARVGLKTEQSAAARERLSTLPASRKRTALEDPATHDPGRPARRPQRAAARTPASHGVPRSLDLIMFDQYDTYILRHIYDVLYFYLLERPLSSRWRRPVRPHASHCIPRAREGIDLSPGVPARVPRARGESDLLNAEHPAAQRLPSYRGSL